MLSGGFWPPGHFAAKGLVPRPLDVGTGLLLLCCLVAIVLTDEKYILQQSLCQDL